MQGPVPVAVTLDEHAFATNDPLTFRAQAGGSLPAPLVEGTTYYAIEVDDARILEHAVA